MTQTGYLSVQMLYITLMVARQTAIDRNERIAQLEQQLAQASSSSSSSSSSSGSSATDLLPESSTDLLPESLTDRPPESSTDLPPESLTDLPPESSTDLPPPDSSTDLPPESTTLHSELVTRVFAEFVSPAALAAQLEPLAEQSLTALRAGHRSPLYMQLANELQGEIESRQAVTNTEADDAQGEAEGGPVETSLEAPAAGQSAEEREEPEDPLLASLLQLLGGQASARTAHGPLMHRSLPEQRWWSRQRQPAWGGVSSLTAAAVTLDVAAGPVAWPVAPAALLPPRMLDLVLFCAAVSTGFYLFYWYRLDLVRAAEARQRACARRQADDLRRAARFRQVARVGGAACPEFHSIQDSFHSHGELMRAIRRSGLRRLRAVLGVDFSASNEWQGNRSFGHQSLHRVVTLKPSNPYQRAIQAVGRALEPLLDGGDVFAYGFGDTTTRGSEVFPLRPDGQPCPGCRTPTTRWPPWWLPLRTRSPSRLVGVGDGPWDTMEALDDFVPARRFDNFQFVDFNQACPPGAGAGHELVFATHLLMEVPEHFRLLCERGCIQPREHTPAATAASLTAECSRLAAASSAGPGVSAEAPHGWPRVVRVESSPTRVIAGDPTPRLRRKMMSLR
ncbi:Copine family protein 1 [Amphibalanus amphitrite]|uniref:Copine family protein 1 n=1 Tax=Amphibalanus amphitrite TaxID=1232801 RepID=A0A6A4VYT6_AMPAM|nr:Copine family protein 1 [Amphibalanus amphitrite]